MAPSLTEYYRGKNIFITGATGFIGKVLVEKLLRSCSDLGTLYLLMRPKKGLSTEERLSELMYDNKLFASLKESKPNVFKKVKLMTGDILDDDLGLSNDDREELQKKCNIIFHVAACVRFDLRLKNALDLNTKGTLRALKLAETMQNLDAFVQLSTAYCRCELEVLEEKLYPVAHKPAQIIEMVDWMDDSLLDHLEPKLITPEPNTYSYTKALTEDLVADYGSKFPIAIARPSIVSAIWKEPIPGWVDNIYGPTGIVIGCLKGVIRTMHCNPTYNVDGIPVDVVANGCILVAYATAVDRPKETRIYNLTLSGVIKTSWGQIVEAGRKWNDVYPFEQALWYSGGSPKSSWILHQVHHIFAHLLPAYFIDMILFLLGKKTFMIDLQKRISHGLKVLQYYTTKEWHFKNNNFLSLRNRISENENNTFYTDMSTFNIEQFLKNYILGARLYCAKEDLSNLPRARRLHKIRYVVDKLTKVFLYGLLIWLLYTYIYIFSSCFGFVKTTLKSLF